MTIFEKKIHIKANPWKHFMVLALIPECHFFTVNLSEESGRHSFSFFFLKKNAVF